VEVKAEREHRQVQASTGSYPNADVCGGNPYLTGVHEIVP